MNASDMELYKQIERAIRQHAEYLNVGNSVTESDVRHAIRWVMRNNPDIFWFVHQYHFDKDNGIVSFRYRCSPERCAIIQESIDDVVVNDFKIAYVRTLTQLEQVAYVYKWMLTYCNYNTNSAYNQNIDSVFVRRNSVCTGYAKAAHYLFKLLGIESRLVFGRLNNDKEEGRHCWNIVCIQGRYYHLDICLGDLSLEDVIKKAGATSLRRYGDYNFNCFCVSTEEILKTRSIEDVESLPLCDSTLPTDEVERLSHIEIKERDEIIGCLLTHIGSSADIFLCTRDKDVVLKKFRGNDTQKCEEEYANLQRLKECDCILHLCDKYTNIQKNIIAIEQSTPLLDLLQSSYFYLTIGEVMRIARDIACAWLECYEIGVVYRDLHVSNVYRSNDGRYVLGDLEGAYFSNNQNNQQWEGKIGAPWFMAPETYSTGVFTEQSAVYSITAICFFLVNGLRPAFWSDHEEDNGFRGKMQNAVVRLPYVLNEKLPYVFLYSFSNFIIRGCALLPEYRFSSIHEFIEQIEVLISIIGNYNVVVYGEKQEVLSNQNDKLEDPFDWEPPLRTKTIFWLIDITNERINRIQDVLRNKIKHYCEQKDYIYKISVLLISDDCEWMYSHPIDVNEFHLCPLSPRGVNANYKKAFKRLNDVLSSKSYLKSDLLQLAPLFVFFSNGFSLDDCKSDFEILKRNRWFQVGQRIVVPLDNNPIIDSLVEFTGDKEFILDKNRYDSFGIVPIEDIAVSICASMVASDKDVSSSLSGSSDMTELWYDQIKGHLDANNVLENDGNGDWDDWGDWDNIETRPVPKTSFFPNTDYSYFEKQNKSVWNRFWDKVHNSPKKVYSSVFAPAEVKPKSRMLVQVYLHLFEETEKVKSLALESDRNAERRDYIPLQCKLKKGDKVDVLLNIYGETLLMSDRKIVVWQGTFNKCSFDYFVPKDIDVDELSCVAMLSVNGVPVGEMRFITKIVETPRKLNPEIIAHKYSKVFISYSHQDESKVKFLHEGLELGAVPHFFDRKYLKAGDVFPQVIQDYINSADLFILCWSENASKSEYVQKERLQALERAFPQVKPEQDAKLRIYPMSIEPRAELPSDMKENYHFGEL